MLPDILSGVGDAINAASQMEEIRESLLSLGLLIIVAKLAEGIFRRLRLNSILAYAAAGILLGPTLQAFTGWSIHPTGHIDLLLTLGIFIFFFLIGLDEIDMSSFVATLRGHYFVAALVSVAFSLGVSLLVTTGLLANVVDGFGLHLNPTDALALAGVLSMSSLGIVAKVLADDGRLREPIGLQIFTIVLIAELITLLVITFSIGEHAHEISLTGVLFLMAKIVGFAAVAWLLSSRVLPPLVARLQRLIQVPQLSLGLLLGTLFLVVDGAEVMGLHGALGALLFGASLSGLPYQVRVEIMPGLRSTAEAIFVPLFFASAGLHFTFNFVDIAPLTMVALVLIPLSGNFIGALLGAYVARLAMPQAVASGLMGKGVAEIALLLVLWELTVIDEAVFSFLVLVMFCYLLLTPSLISFVTGRASRSLASRARASVNPELVEGRTARPDDIPRGIFRFVLSEIAIDDILDRTRRHPTPALTVRDFTERWANPYQHDYVVADDAPDGNRFVAGVLSLDMLRYLPEQDWPTTPISRLLRPVGEIRESPLLAFPDEHVEDVLQRMRENSMTAIPVVDRVSERFVGVVNSNDILQLVLKKGRP